MGSVILLMQFFVHGDDPADVKFLLDVVDVPDERLVSSGNLSAFSLTLVLWNTADGDGVRALLLLALEEDHFLYVEEIAFIIGDVRLAAERLQLILYNPRLLSIGLVHACTIAVLAIRYNSPVTAELLLYALHYRRKGYLLP
jgi:hypothetical protein